MSNTQSRRDLSWSQVDVFAEAPYQGNMLAIFEDATGLTEAEMQMLARETNLSETTFVLPRSQEIERACGVRVRIFTVQEELPFAGHPTLGTASWLRAHHPGLRGAQEVRLELAVGMIAVRFPAGPTGLGVYGEMHQSDPQFGSMPSQRAVAQAIGMAVADLHPKLPPQVVSTGLPFLIVPLRSVEVAKRLRVLSASLQPLLESVGARFAYCIAPTEAGAVAQWRARMQFYGGEDPATGSAAGCAISYLVFHRAAPSSTPLVIEQGVEMSRPSKITAQATWKGDQVGGVIVGGRTIPVASGRFIL